VCDDVADYPRDDSQKRAKFAEQAMIRENILFGETASKGAS
jgi:hypothetical protein